MTPVRQSAKELTSLILDEERLRAERHDRKLWKQRVTGLDEFGAAGGFGGGPEPNANNGNNRRRKPQRSGSEDDLEYKLALEASKNQADEDAKRRQNSSHGPETDDDLAKALKLSKEEEELRKRELEDSNANALFDFDSTPSQQQQQAQPTGWNQGYQQQGAVDWFGNPLDQQQPQTTGFLNNAYAQNQLTGTQPQQTGFQNGFGYNNNPYQQQPQQTGFDQAQFQQPQQTMMQPQQTAFSMNNPYAQPNVQPQQPQEQAMQSGSNNPWGSNANNVDSMKPQPTGSNNPFGSSFNRPQTQTASAQRAPTLGTLQEQKTAQFSNFNSTPSPFSQPAPQQPAHPFPTQPMQQQQTAQQMGKPADPHRANLNTLLASGEGQDTFGNAGDLRIPAQHTAPGQFANSAGTGRTGIMAQQTGNNPFLHNQFTGGPSPAPMQQPAQTGPAIGFGNSNPFGQNRQQGPGSNLIDI